MANRWKAWLRWGRSGYARGYYAAYEEAEARHQRQRQRIRDLATHADMMARALALTQEYIGDGLLPPREGWSWFDALEAHAKRKHH